MCLIFLASDTGHCGRQDTETGIPRLLCYRTVLFFLREGPFLPSPKGKEQTSKTWIGLGIDAMLNIPSILAFEIFFLSHYKRQEEMRQCLVLLTSSDVQCPETVPESENYVNSNYRICSFQDWHVDHWYEMRKSPKHPTILPMNW